MAGTRKGTYKITNWSKYNESLVQRGSITFWFCEETIKKWRHDNANPGVGHPFVYSDTAVECLLVLRELFQLPYRQTEGLGKSLVELMRIELEIPDYTSLAKRGKINGFYGDGAYDKWKVYETLGNRRIKAIVPPQRNAKIKRHGNSSSRPLSRDVAIRAIRHRGRRRWKEDIGYHRRSLSETAMYRMKCCFGDHLKNRKIHNQRTETRLRSKILNRFTQLGLPEFVWN